MKAAPIVKKKLVGLLLSEPDYQRLREAAAASGVAMAAYARRVTMEAVREFEEDKAIELKLRTRRLMNLDKRKEVMKQSPAFGGMKKQSVRE